MRKRILLTGTIPVLLLITGTAAALPFSSFDPRSFGMGGTGVASGTSANAVFFNPALLAAAHEDEDFSLELPILGARAADPDNFVDAVDDFNNNNSILAFQNAVDAYTLLPNAGNAAAVQAAGNALIADFQNISNKAVQLEGDAAVVVGIPGKGLGISVFGNLYGVGGGVGDFTANDATLIQTTISDALALNPTSDPTGSFTSSVSGRFAAITEAGVAVARDFSGVAVGVTPKFVRVRTYDYKFVGSNIDNADISLDQGERSESNFNVDIGAAKDFGNGFKAGAAIKNVIAQEYTTVLGNKIKIEPMARVGVMHQTDWTTIALDVDLTENEPAGYESKSRYIALGAELDLFDTLQLRFGYRNNTSSTGSAESDTLSAGVGFSPFGVHVDLAVAGNSDEIGGAMQLGFRF